MGPQLLSGLLSANLASKRLSLHTRRAKVYVCAKWLLMKDFHNRRLSLITRSVSVFCAASFLFFLLYSAPHRVHHFFDQVQPADHHSDNRRDKPDHHQKRAGDSDCVFQASASHCAIGLTAQIAPFTLAPFVQNLVSCPESPSRDLFLSGSFQIRAPPQI